MFFTLFFVQMVAASMMILWSLWLYTCTDPFINHLLGAFLFLGGVAGFLIGFNNILEIIR